MLYLLLHPRRTAAVIKAAREMEARSRISTQAARNVMPDVIAAVRLLDGGPR